MTMIIDGTNGITFNNATTQASAGSVLQVVSANYTTSATSTSTTPVTTGLTATITPKFSTSKILVMISAVAGANNSTGAAAESFQLFRGASSVATFANAIYLDASVIIPNSTIPLIYLDFPATTSATAYTLYYYIGASGNRVYLNQNTASQSTITLMEIAG
jgi:hypothetical protein